MKTDNNQKLISEELKPVADTIDTLPMSLGEPGLPREFIWRGEPLTIKTVLNSWRDTGPCRNGSRERYIRKHWYDIETVANQKARIYFDRQPRDQDPKKRWWLFSIDSDS